jgi:hypothetical protein
MFQLVLDDEMILFEKNKRHDIENMRQLEWIWIASHFLFFGWSFVVERGNGRLLGQGIWNYTKLCAWPKID